MDKKAPKEEDKAALCAATDGVENEECVEKESPVEMLSEATDAMQSDTEAPLNDVDTDAADAEAHPNVHNMSKEELVAAIKDIVDNNKMESHRDVTALKQAFFALRSRERLEELNAYIDEGNDPAAFAATPDELENEFNEYYATFKERRQAYLAADEARRLANLEKKQEILDKMREIAGDIDNVNVRFADFQQLQADFRNIKDVPASAETEIWKSFQTVGEQFYDHLKMNKELRDLDFKKNLESKRNLIEQAKELDKEPDPIKAFRQLQTLHDEWRNIGPVAKDIRESIWEEFREASAAVNKRHQEYYEQRKASEQINEAGKLKLCEEIESINPMECTTYTMWNQQTDKIKELQQQWKTYGYASRKANAALYARFRKACDNFFEAKTKFFHDTRESLSQNLARKTALCERVEALKENPDVKNPTEEVVKLQAEWKTIGSVPRKQSQEIWKRFNDACNFFFENRKREMRERRKDENDNLAAKREIIAQLKALPLDGDRREVIGKVRELQNQWNEIGFVPFKYKDSIFSEYREACDTLYNTYKERETSRRMSSWQERIGKMNDGQKVNSERDKLVRALENRKNDLLTYENNMGFFNVKSSAGNSMVKDLQRKIERLKEEIEEIKTKIRLIDHPVPKAEEVKTEETKAEETAPVEKPVDNTEKESDEKA